jgi:hypothetical protein
MRSGRCENDSLLREFAKSGKVHTMLHASATRSVCRLALGQSSDYYVEVYHNSKLKHIILAYSNNKREFKSATIALALQAPRVFTNVLSNRVWASAYVV